MAPLDYCSTVLWHLFHISREIAAEIKIDRSRLGRSALVSRDGTFGRLSECADDLLDGVGMHGTKIYIISIL